MTEEGRRPSKRANSSECTFGLWNRRLALVCLTALVPLTALGATLGAGWGEHDREELMAEGARVNVAVAALSVAQAGDSARLTRLEAQYEEIMRMLARIERGIEDSAK